MKRIITLLSDFGISDPYVAEMKAVILTHYPAAVIVDITHQVDKYNVQHGSYLLEMVVPHFPSGTVHVAVVDPGVGSKRLPLVLECEASTFLVGPDNGLLIQASERLGLKSAYKVTNPQFHTRIISGTFHGRDVFAVTAARLAAGSMPRKAGDRITKLVSLASPRPRFSKGSLECSVIHIDSFGNVVTNATVIDLHKLGDSREVWVECDNRRIRAVIADSYSELRTGELAIVEGSQSYVELAVREGSAALKTGLRISDTFRMRSVSKLSGRSSKSPASARHRQFA